MFYKRFISRGSVLEDELHKGNKFLATEVHVAVHVEKCFDDLHVLGFDPGINHFCEMIEFWSVQFEIAVLVGLDEHVFGDRAGLFVDGRGMLELALFCCCIGNG